MLKWKKAEFVDGKVIVPAFVTQWFEENKERLEMNIYSLLRDTYTESSKELDRKVLRWIEDGHSNGCFSALVHMAEEGYIAEEELKDVKAYVIPLPEGFKTEVGGFPLFLWNSSGKRASVADNVDYKEALYSLNELEAMGEHWKAIAVTVEEGKAMYK